MEVPQWTLRVPWINQVLGTHMDRSHRTHVGGHIAPESSQMGTTTIPHRTPFQLPQTDGAKSHSSTAPLRLFVACSQWQRKRRRSFLVIQRSHHVFGTALLLHLSPSTNSCMLRARSLGLVAHGYSKKKSIKFTFRMKMLPCHDILSLLCICKAFMFRVLSECLAQSLFLLRLRRIHYHASQWKNDRRSGRQRASFYGCGSLHVLSS